MPGFKPRPDLAFRDIHIAVIRLTNASSTPQQHEVIRNLLNGLAQIEPLWGVTSVPVAKRKGTDARVPIPPYILGQIAREQSIPREANPYEPKSEDWQQWDAGWCYMANNPRSPNSGSN